MKALSPLELTPFRNQLSTESNQSYINLKKEHLTAERLLKIPLFERRFKEGIGDTYTSCKYIRHTLTEITIKLKRTVKNNIDNLKKQKLLDYYVIEKNINYEKSQVTFTLTWSNYYISETITSFTVNILL